MDEGFCKGYEYHIIKEVVVIRRDVQLYYTRE